jgi:hypothetical protein
MLLVAFLWIYGFRLSLAIVGIRRTIKGIYCTNPNNNGSSNMQRVYGSVEDSLLHRIDQDAMQKGISRSKWLSNAIELYLNHNGAEICTDTTNLDMQISHLKELIGVKDGEIQHLRYLTNDLRSLADNLASKVPALTGPANQIQTQDIPESKKSWWHFW